MRCAVCPNAVRPTDASMSVRTDTGRLVTLRFHPACANAHMLQVAQTMRQHAVGSVAAVARGRAECMRRRWSSQEVRALRHRLGITQDELGGRLGASRQSVYRHEIASSDAWIGMGSLLTRLEIEACQKTGVTMNEWIERSKGAD